MRPLPTGIGNQDVAQLLLELHVISTVFFYRKDGCEIHLSRLLELSELNYTGIIPMKYNGLIVHGNL
jgi:hypothetical protein